MKFRRIFELYINSFRARRFKFLGRFAFSSKLLEVPALRSPATLRLCHSQPQYIVATQKLIIGGCINAAVGNSKCRPVRILPGSGGKEVFDRTPSMQGRHAAA